MSSAASERSLAARAAWLHYAGGLTQSQVAKRMGLNSLKAHRLITRANQDGLVKVFIDGDVGDCLELESALSERWGLGYCYVVPDFDDDALPLNALGTAGAQYLQRCIESKDIQSIGIGHGRMLAAVVDHLPTWQAENTRFVSLLGGLTRNFSANPHDVIHRLAHRTQAQAYVMPVPFFANSSEDRDVLLSQRGISDVFDLACGSDVKIVGIGTTESHASLLATGMIEADELTAASEAGGISEVLGHFFNETGEQVETDLTRRTLTLPIDALQEQNVVAVAGGVFKTRAIRSVLNSRLVSGLITEERTARSLLET